MASQELAMGVKKYIIAFINLVRHEMFSGNHQKGILSIIACRLGHIAQNLFRFVTPYVYTFISVKPYFQMMTYGVIPSSR